MMQDFSGKKILLGVCGGIAAYKSIMLVRELVQLGARVQVIMSHSAIQFVTPLTFQAISGLPVRTHLFDEAAEQAMGHIELARWADLFLIAPASANCLAKLAHGLADDLLSTVALATRVPILVSPAMNQNMWSHPATMANFQLLATRGVVFVGPDMGSQACGDFGWGRMSEPSTIINALRLHAVSGLLHGRHVVISAGPTEEAIDPVRFVSNRSSGKMGYALAEAALMAGALVTLVSGPVRLSAPAGIHRVSVRTALEMRAAVLEQLTPGSVFIATAAVADFRACETVSQKIKKTEDSGNLIVAFEKNPDIVQDVVHAKLADFVVCFAAETEFMLEHARDKFKRKQVDMLVANRVGAGLGFDVDENEVVIITKDGEETLPLQHKVRIAGNLIAMIAAKLHNTTF